MATDPAGLPGTPADTSQPKVVGDNGFLTMVFHQRFVFLTDTLVEARKTYEEASSHFQALFTVANFTADESRVKLGRLCNALSRADASLQNRQELRELGAFWGELKAALHGPAGPQLSDPLVSALVDLESAKTGLTSAERDVEKMCRRLVEAKDVQ